MPSLLTRWRGYTAAAGFVLLAFGVRLLLAPALHDRSPLLLFTLAVLATAAGHGVRPAIFATATGGLLGVWAFMTPFFGFGIMSAEAWANIGVYLLTSLGILFITETLRRSRAEVAHTAEALRESDAELRHAIEVNPQVPWTADPQGRILGFNERWVTLTGRSREELLGAGWMEVPHPEDRDAMVAAWTRSLATGEPYDVEHRVRTADGSFRWMRSSAYPHRGPDGKILRWYGLTEDVEERKRVEVALAASEARYRTLFESIDAGFCVVEMIFEEGRPVDYRILEVNPVFSQQTGLSEAKGRTARALVPGLEDFWVERYGHVAQTGQPARFESGSEAMGRWFDVHAVPIGAAAPHHVAVLFNDISDRRRAEEEVLRLNRDLEALVAVRTAALQAANGQLEAFAYTVSHDLRAPLRGMEGFARILLDDFAEPLGPKGRRYAERIVAAAERMEGLISDLLTFSRLQRAQVSLRPLDPTLALRKAAEEARALPGAEGAVIEIASPLPLVMAEPTVLGHVAGNLLTNAVKFRRMGEPARVRVWAEDRGSRVRLWIEDQGIGIAPEHQGGIFGAFERLHGQEEYPGTGIGLAIVQAGMERLGGSVGVESEAGGGARFWIELAAADKAEQNQMIKNDGAKAPM